MRKALIGVVAVLAIAVSANAELLVNGTFDDGMNNWTFGRAGWGNQDNALALSAGDSVGAHSPSTHNFDPAARTSFGGDPNGSRWIAQAVSGLTVGETYTLTGLLGGGIGHAQDMPVNSGAWWQIGYKPGGYDAGALDAGTGCVNVLNIEAPTGASHSFDWIAANGNFVAADSTYTIYVKYGAVNVNWQYYGVYVDNLSLTPEPAAAMLLLAGLPLLRRRRS